LCCARELADKYKVVDSVIVCASRNIGHVDYWTHHKWIFRRHLLCPVSRLYYGDLTLINERKVGWLDVSNVSHRLDIKIEKLTVLEAIT